MQNVNNIKENAALVTNQGTEVTDQDKLKTEYQNNENGKVKRVYYKTKRFIRKHRKEIIIIGGTFATGALFAIYKHYSGSLDNEEINSEFVESIVARINETMDSLNEADVELYEEVDEESGFSKREYKEPFDVKRHLMNLPSTKNPSPEKIQEAMELGIILKEHQTIRDEYRKGA